MSARLLVDDHLLVRVLLGQEPDELRRDGQPIATTGLWYHRLCRALADATVTGSLSRSLGDVGPDLARRAVASTIDLPDDVELISLRELGWPMATHLAEGHRLNLLSLEALAAAAAGGATICLGATDRNPPLQAAASRLGIEVRLIDA